jgi:hypothetical protein
MPIQVQHRCHLCSALREPSGRAAWVRCDPCDVIIGLDLQAWLESADRDPSEPEELLPRWVEYQQRLELAARASVAGDSETCRGALREACILLLELTPVIYPPAVGEPGPYRERYLDWRVWWMVYQHFQPEGAALADKLQHLLSALDLRDPVPALRAALDLLGEMHRRAAALDAPPDPDRMPADVRARVALGLLCAGTLRVLEPERRLGALRVLHGEDGVHVVGELADDDGGLFRIWSCPRCGLCSLQTRTAAELTCPGCFHQRPSETSAPLLHDRQQPREVTGLPFAADERRGVVLAGLARQASWFSSLVSPQRYLLLLRRSLPEAAAPELRAALAELRELVVTERGEPEALLLVDDAARLLA